MAETLTIIPRTKLTVPRPKIRSETNSAEKLTVDFTSKKSSPSSDKLTVSADSYNAILEEMRPVHNKSAKTESRLHNNKAQAELADAQEIVRRVGGRPSSQKPDKTRRKGKRDQQSSEEDQTAQKRRTQARGEGESEKTSKEDDTEPELGRLEFARALRSNPTELTHLRRVLPPRDYQQLEARLEYWEKFEEREENLASLAHKAAVARASAQKKWDRVRESLAQSLTLGIVPKEYSLGERAEIIREVIRAVNESRTHEKQYLDARRAHLATVFEEPSSVDPEFARHPEKTDSGEGKKPMFGLAVRIDLNADTLAKKLSAIAKQR